MANKTVTAKLGTHLIRLSLLVILVMLFHFSGLGRHLTDISYRWLNIAAQHPDGARSILLVNASGQALSSDELYWRKLLREINVHRPRHVILAVEPKKVGRSFYRELASGPPASIAVEAVASASGTVRAGSHSAVSRTLPRGWLLPITINSDGTLGYYTGLDEDRDAKRTDAGDDIEAIEIQVLRSSRTEAKDTSNSQNTGSKGGESAEHTIANINPLPSYFRVVAPRTGHPLLEVDANYVVESGLVPDLVEDRWVIIGQGNMVSGTITAGRSKPDIDSSLQQRGHLLTAVLEGLWLRVLPGWQDWLIILGLAGLCYGLSSVIPDRYRRWFYGLWIAGAAFSLAAALRWLQLQLPVAELVFIPFFYMVINSYYRRQEEKVSFNQVLEMTEARMVKQRELSDFFISEDYWEKILVMIRQTLQLEAAIILERPTEKFHLDIVVKFGCSEALVYEKRRDFRRAPFDTALQYGKPIQPERPFFEIDKHLEIQYMCPLYHGGEILGFWALSLSRETVLNTPRFEEILQKYSVQISELLYSRQIMARGNTGLLDTNPKTDQLAYDKHIVFQRVMTLESQLSSHINLIDTTKTGCLLYDLFGNLVLANTAAQSFARNNSVAIFDGNALDLMVTLTGCSPERGRETLLDIIVHNSSATLPVTIERGVATHVIHICLVQSDTEHNESSIAPRPFDAQGILFEIIDNSRIARLHREKESLLVNLTASAVDMVQGAYFALSAIKRTLSNNDESTEDAEELETILDDITAVMSSLNEQLYLSEDIIRSGHLYVDMKIAVENSITRHGHQVIARMMEVKANLSDYCELAKANVSDLERTLERMWALMLETAEEGSQLQILVDQKEMNNKNIIRCAFKNRGYGLTPGIIDAFNRRDLEHLTPTLSALRLVTDDIKGWGGTLILRSSLGKSLTVIMALETFSDHH